MRLQRWGTPCAERKFPHQHIIGINEEALEPVVDGLTMTKTLNCRDESMTGRVEQEFSLDVDELVTNMSVAELIELRINQELGRPQELTNEHLAEEASSQHAIALKAFAQNQLLVLVDNTQVETLQDRFDVGFQTKVSFVKLVALQGG